MNTQGPSKVVLIVDDEENFFEIYAWQLEHYPSLKFLHAQSGHEAYAVLGQHKVDVVKAVLLEQRE